MKEDLLEFLVCPLCSSGLKSESFVSDKGRIQEGLLECSRGDRFPVIGGIPILIEPYLRSRVLGEEETLFWKRHPEHRPVGAAESDTKDCVFKKESADVWGYQWQDFHDIWQDHAGEEQFYRWIQPLRPEDLKDKIVLDAGCGTGRHVLYAVRHAKQVIGVDLSFATRVSARLTQDIPNAHIIQADIYHLPFRPETFDRILSIGVIHHLPDPQGAYRSLAAYAKKGGSITAWLYGRENNWFAACAMECARVVTRRLPLPLLKILSILPALILRLAMKFFYVPFNRLAPGAAARLPYNTYFMLFHRLSFRNLWSMVFDQLDAPIANYYRKVTMEEWLKDSGFGETRLSHTNDISWTIHGIRSC